MSYCINPWCSNRENLDSSSVCQTCGTNLIIQGEYSQYSIIRSLIDPNHPHPYTEVFLICDTHNPDRLKVVKTLKTDNSRKLVKLFEQERDLLNDLQHDGIPQYEDYFVLALTEPRRPLRCLVIEYIEGMTLEKWANMYQLDEETALDWLEELVRILGYVHKNHFFHRDIKPSNVIVRSHLRRGNKLVLIDFGTAREYTNTVIDGHHITQVASGFYTAPEQRAGQAIPQSDFYALGVTFVYLLTGYPPGKGWNFRTNFPTSKLIQLIEKLIQPEPTNRPQTARDILFEIQRIRQNEIDDIEKGLIRTEPLVLKPESGDNDSGAGIWLMQLFQQWWSPTTFAIAAFCLAIVFSIRKCRPSFLPLEVNSPSESIPEVVSEIPLESIAKHELVSLSDKKLALEVLQQAKNSKTVEAYKAAIDALEDLRYGPQNEQGERQGGNRKDPEVWIYLNNTKAEQRAHTNNTPLYTTAVAAPLGIDPGISILRGVASAQERAFAAGINLKVIIENDHNSENIVQNLAQELVNNDKILAVVGHYSSEVTLRAIKVYQNYGLTVISPGSTSTELSNQAKDVFVRTVPSNKIEASSLVNWVMNNISSPPKVAVAYSKKVYARSMRLNFLSALLDGIGSIEGEELLLDLTTDLNKDDLFNASDARQWIFEVDAADVIALFPDGQTAESGTFEQAQEIIKANNGEKYILGSNPLHENELAQAYGQYLNCKLIVGAAWFSDEDNKLQENKHGNLYGGAPNARVAHADDAVQVIVTAIQNSRDNLQDLYKQLSNPLGEPGTNDLEIWKEMREQIRQTIKVNGFTANSDFNTSGNGQISFEPNGNRSESEVDQFIPLTLVENSNSTRGSNKYRYVPWAKSSCGD